MFNSREKMNFNPSEQYQLSYLVGDNCGHISVIPYNRYNGKRFLDDARSEIGKVVGANAEDVSLLSYSVRNNIIWLAKNRKLPYFVTFGYSVGHGTWKVEDCLIDIKNFEYTTKDYRALSECICKRLSEQLSQKEQINLCILYVQRLEKRKDYLKVNFYYGNSSSVNGNLIKSVTIPTPKKAKGFQLGFLNKYIRECHPEYTSRISMISVHCLNGPYTLKEKLSLKCKKGYVLYAAMGINKEDGSSRVTNELMYEYVNGKSINGVEHLKECLQNDLRRWSKIGRDDEVVILNLEEVLG